MGLNNAFADMFGASQRSAGGAPAYLPDFIGSILRGESGGKINKSGSNYKASLKLSAVYNAVQQISDSNAIIPYSVFQKTKEGREKLTDHPINTLLESEPDGPDGYLTTYIFKKISTVSMQLRGNCLWEIKTDRAGNQLLKYIPWDNVQDIKMVEGVLVYMIKGGKNLLAHEVLHFKAFTLDGIVGISVITYACIQMNLAIEVQAFSATVFEHKGIRNGVISTDKILSVEGQKGKIITGFRNAMAEKSPDRIVVLDDGLKYTPINITPQEAQIIEMNRFTVEDVARWFNIAPHKIKSLQQSTNNNIEQQSLDYLSDTMQPIVTNFEQEFHRKLLTRKERSSGVYIKGNMNVLLRTDIKSRGEYYSKMVNSGIYLANEVRELEEKNTLPGGNELRIPVNTQTQSQIDQNKENE